MGTMGNKSPDPTPRQIKMACDKIKSTLTDAELRARMVGHSRKREAGEIPWLVPFVVMGYQQDAYESRDESGTR